MCLKANGKLQGLSQALLVNVLVFTSLVACTGTYTSQHASTDASSAVKLNQIGFLPNNSKVAVVFENSGDSFELVDAATHNTVFSGRLSDTKYWKDSKESVRLADFSAFKRPGNYLLRVAGVNSEIAVTIKQDAFADVHDAALKAYYYNRASTALEKQYAGPWHRQAGHLDTEVKVHASASTAQRPAGTIISSPKGWYDAGDYNKYVVNSGISTYTLLAAYSHFTEFYRNRDIDIPESGDDMPDILDEVQWNLDWMLTMQDPSDGGVYHKLTTLNFAKASMPAEANEQRYVVQKGTAAALNLAAVMAKASRVYGAFESRKALANTYKKAALDAWQWAQDNPNVIYKQPEDVKTGAYGDKTFDDERLWAAAELFLLTEDSDFLTTVKATKNLPKATLVVPSWPRVSGLAYISLLQNDSALIDADADLYQELRQGFLHFADSIVKQHDNSAYAVAMEGRDFHWGGNAFALNKAMVLLNAYKLSPQIEYKMAVNALLDYVLGRNPTGFSFVTGYGNKTPMHPHHRQSESDDVLAPVPGFLVGGPQPQQQDGCDYPSDLPAMSYLDDWCSYSTNEVTINWNAPLVYTLAGLQVMQ